MALVSVKNATLDAEKKKKWKIESFSIFLATFWRLDFILFN